MKNEDVNQLIGSRIRNLREAAGLSQEEFARLLGVGRTAVSMWESGRNKPRLDKIYKMSKILGVKPEDIVPSLSVSEIELLDIPKPVKIIPIYSLPVSAGNGMFPDEIYILDKLPVHRVDVDFAVKVDGDSMEPVVPDGAIVFVKETPEARDGDMVLCTYDDHVFVKWFHRRGDDIYLISENPLYSPIKVEEHDKFIIHGVVMDVLRGGKPRRKFK